MRIILFGYRGSGKTSVGKLLAKRLGLAFADGDDATRQRFNHMAIADIWQQFGEPEFRQREAEATRDLCGRDDIVVSLGGGAILRADSQQVIRETDALRVYLKGSPAVLHQRIHGDANTDQDRPNLTHLGGGIEEIESVLSQRRPIYESLADVIIDVDDFDIEQVADAIVQVLKTR